MGAFDLVNEVLMKQAIPACIHCGKEFEPEEHEMYDLQEEGVHKIDCPFCEEPITVKTTVIQAYSVTA